jgi:hypothetical protein
MEELQTLMKIKVDKATLRLLQEATDRADPETFNLQYAIKTDDVTLSVWKNRVIWRGGTICGKGQRSIN